MLQDQYPTTMRTNIAIFLLALVILYATPYCKRNKDCDAIITVVDAVNNAPVSGASVHIYPDPASGGNLTIQDQTEITEGNREARFTFKLPAILKVDVDPKSPYLKPAPRLIKLEEGKSTPLTIKLLK